LRQIAAASEQAALFQRYDSAAQRAIARGAGAPLKLLEQEASRSFAVVNLKLAFLREVVTERKTLFANYHAGVTSGVRRAAADAEDQARRGVDAILFRSYADKIRFAALTSDGPGLISYGPYTLRLREVAVAERSSVLEQNSFDFIRSHRLGPFDRVPEGFRSSWHQRHLLVVAKLADLLTEATTLKDIHRLILSSDGNRANDQFFEVHIYGPFDVNAVERVTGPKPKTSSERAAWSLVVERLKSQGRAVEEIV
jgi:hypothetical protein